jgi:hypothetical protein
VRERDEMFDTLREGFGVKDQLYCRANLHKAWQNLNLSTRRHTGVDDGEIVANLRDLIEASEELLRLYEQNRLGAEDDGDEFETWRRGLREEARIVGTARADSRVNKRRQRT